MGTSVSRAAMAHARTIFAALAALALTLTFAPSALFADDSVAASSALESVAGPLAGPGYEGDAQSASPNSDLSSSAEGSTLASTLAGTPASIVSADVALDASDPIIGSFTVDGLTYAVGTSGLALVAVASDVVADGAVSIPASVTYDGMAYDVTAVGPYAFYLSGATSVALPTSVTLVDDRAFRSSDVERVEVAADNPNLASFDGCLYDSQLISLLLIPEGRAGAVLLPETAEVVEPSKFSHCSLVDAISVEEGGADFASWDGLLYDASGTTLLRVPAGATDITIRDGCTAIAAGAVEGCAKLEHINASASVASISPDVFTSIPTVSLPAQTAMHDDASSSVASSLLDQANAPTDFIPQLSAMVALSSADDDIPNVDPSSIKVCLGEESGKTPWESCGFQLEGKTSPIKDAGGLSIKAVIETDQGYDLESELQDAASYAADTCTLKVYAGSYGGNVSGSGVGSGNPLVITGVENFAAYGPSSAGYGTLQFHKNGTLYTVAAGDRPGVTCVGWQVCGLGYASGASAIHGNGSNGDVVIVAVWSDYTFRVTYNANGGVLSYWDSWAYMPGQTVTFTSPSRKGYTFNGWYGNSSFSGSPITSVTATANGSLSLWAKWTVNNYTINWNANGGSVSPKSWTRAYDTVLGTLPVPTRPGYTFSGWYTAASGGTQVSTSTKVMDDVTYYARWTANTIALTWNSQGGSSVGSTSATYSSTAKVPMPASNPTKVGYTFAGWWTAASGGTQVTSSTALPASNKTYFAHWSTNPYEIAYELAGGAVSGNPTTYNIETDTFTLKNPARQGYIFTGWSGTGLSGEGNIEVKVVKGSTGNRSYVAHWRPTVSAAVPVEVTARVDLLDIEEQVEATGYIESRSGGSLKVAEVAFTPLGGAAELFASSSGDVFLEALATGSASADYRFALDSAAIEADASKLAAFALPDGYGTRVGIGYRFVIPEDVLAAIDQNSFEQVATPVGRVVYTMALA